MGGRMVKNVLKAGYAVRAQNRTAAKTEALKPLGAIVASTPREAASSVCGACSKGGVHRLIACGFSSSSIFAMSVYACVL